MAALSTAWLKIVPAAPAPAPAVTAVRELLTLAAGDGRALACFASGRRGSLTRLLAPAWGSLATYGSMGPGSATGEGQLPASEMLSVHDVLGVGRATRLVALVGGAVGSSPSPAMHDAAYRAAGLDARYLPIEAERFEDVLPLCGPEGSIGLAALAVTIPFKHEAFARCASADDLSRAARAVNTVRIEPGGWAGHNTDGPAVVELVRRRLDPAGAAVAVVGAGGLARAAAAALAAAGARVTLYGRSPARTAAAAAELGLAAGSLADLPRAAWRVLVQATPAGAEGQELLPDEALRGELVVEALYGKETPLLRAARRRGVAAIDGLELLAAQAVRQCALMTGCPADPLHMTRAGREWLAARG
jgi:shikimate dehydrogenase